MNNNLKISDFVRKELVESLMLDLVGPTDSLSNTELLPFSPGKMYLSGFLAPKGAPADQRSDEENTENIDEVRERVGIDDEGQPEKPAKKKNFFPSSIGASFILSGNAKEITCGVSWGQYTARRPEEIEVEGLTLEESGLYWQREQFAENVTINIEKGIPDRIEIPNSEGMVLSFGSQPIPPDWTVLGNTPKDAKALSVFVVNEREVNNEEFFKDQSFAFQVELKIKSDGEFLPRPNLRGLILDDADEKLADVQYRNVYEYSVGHGIATEEEFDKDGNCASINTTWIPKCIVEKVAPSSDIDKNVPLEMEQIAEYSSSDQLIKDLKHLILQYQKWIEVQDRAVDSLMENRQEAGKLLTEKQRLAAKRMQAGIESLSDPKVFEAFKLANKCMARAARRRFWYTNKAKYNSPEDTFAPAWRPFQLAFVLLNLEGVADPTKPDRDIVDLLFFPTGGGKTEAYLGLAAFTLVYRRLMNPGRASAGVSVLMRYTLRLLTLDQLGRAAGLICSLELERKENPDLGNWPFEIGLWVGRAATPNRLGARGDGQSEAARSRVSAYKRQPEHKPAPIPMESCPWCGTKLGANSFNLWPNDQNPTRLHVKCNSRPNECEFAGSNNLPILGVDEEIYERLPCFLIATVDKFATLPWLAESGQILGGATRADDNGFYGDAFPGRGVPENGWYQILPPDLIIQDELHLISGPMGTMVGLYEGALYKLSEREIDGQKVGPKIIASTATVRRAHRQIQALFGKNQVEIFPPPGPDLKDSFFAKTIPDEDKGRLYIGIGAQGRSSKVVLLRVYNALLGAAQRLYEENQGQGENPVDPYMTLLGYFNSLRELGGARRIVEDEVTSWLQRIELRKRVGEEAGSFKNRTINRNLVELTSRVNTSEVAEAKRRLGLAHGTDGSVDVALATNMISVGLDISRLGLMAVFGQPKTTSEYIQSTSRVGRGDGKPGLVVTLFNVHRHRDRSFYERFSYSHKTFYRNVEATSVTPFSARALEKGLVGASMTLARHGVKGMCPPRAAEQIEQQRGAIEALLKETFQERLSHYKVKPESELKEMKSGLSSQISDILDSWRRVWSQYDQEGIGMQYAKETDGIPSLIHDHFDPQLENSPIGDQLSKFKVGRSMRDVEETVDIFVSTRGEDAREEADNE